MGMHCYTDFLNISLQSFNHAVLYCAASLIIYKQKYEHDHATPLLIQPYWLPGSQRIIFKVLLSAFKGPYGIAPMYISELLDRYVPSLPLRSPSRGLLRVPPSNTKYGDISFSV